MSSLPKWLLVGGFIAGYAVLLGVTRLLDSSHSIELEDLLVSFAFVYTPVVGGALLVPLLLLPVIANVPRRLKRGINAVLASLLPEIIAI